MSKYTDELQSWPDRSPPVPIDRATEYDWAVALIVNGALDGVYVHKNESSRDAEIQAGIARGVNYVLVADLRAVDRRWKIAHHAASRRRRTP